MITVENLTKSFHTSVESVAALRGVSLEISEGSIHALYGPAGAGKSTLLRLLGLRDRADAGSVRVDGVNPVSVEGRKLRELRSRLAGVDTSLLHPERTAAGNIAAPLEQIGVDGPRRRAKVAELLDLVGLTRAAGLPTAGLNEGQRRRVALARALALSPSVLLFDEPTEGLSSEEAGGVLAALDRTRGELGVTVVLATQDADVVRKICDGISVLAEGTILESGGLLNLLSDQGSFTARNLLPTVAATGARLSGYDSVADVLLIGFATVDGLLPEAGDRFGVEISTVDGGRSRIGETPVARYRVGLRGELSAAALEWIGARGGLVSTIRRAQPARVSRVSELVGRAERQFAGVAA